MQLPPESSMSSDGEEQSNEAFATLADLRAMIETCDETTIVDAAPRILSKAAEMPWEKLPQPTERRPRYNEFSGASSKKPDAAVVQRDVQDAFVDHLPTVFRTIGAINVLQSHQADVLALLCQAPLRVKTTVIEQLSLALEETTVECARELCDKSSAVSVRVLRCHYDGTASQSACIQFFARLATIELEDKLAIEHFFKQPHVTQEIDAMMTGEGKDDQPRYRVHDLTVHLSNISPAVLAVMHESGMLPTIIGELDRAGSDVLLQLNALQCLADLAAGKAHCTRYIHESGVLDKLYARLQESRSSPDGGFLFPGLVKFFGHVAHRQPRAVLVAYPLFAKSVLTMCLNYADLDVTQRLLAFDTLAIVAGTNDGKIVLHELCRSELGHVLPRFWHVLGQGPHELRQRAVQAMQQLIGVQGDDKQAMAVVAEWICLMTTYDGVRPIDVFDDGQKAQAHITAIARLLEMYKVPGPQWHLAVCQLMLAFATNHWAVRAFADTPSALEWVTDRDTDTDWEPVQAKHDLVCQLLHSDDTAKSLTDEQRRLLEEYRAKGALSRPTADPQVALG